jgi:hypothetical protein
MITSDTTITDKSIVSRFASAQGVSGRRRILFAEIQRSRLRVERVRHDSRLASAAVYVR